MNLFFSFAFPFSRINFSSEMGKKARMTIGNEWPCECDFVVLQECSRRRSRRHRRLHRSPHRPIYQFLLLRLDWINSGFTCGHIIKNHINKPSRKIPVEIMSFPEVKSWTETTTTIITTLITMTMMRRRTAPPIPPPSSLLITTTRRNTRKTSGMINRKTPKASKIHREEFTDCHVYLYFFLNGDRQKRSITNGTQLFFLFRNAKFNSNPKIWIKLIGIYFFSWLCGH